MTGVVDAASTNHRLRLLHAPLHQLQPLEDGTWLASGDDPHFLLQPPDASWRPGIYRITAELEGEHIERPCVYIDAGEGWSEASRLLLRPEGSRRWSVLASLPAMAGPARFDPSERAGRFRFGGVSFERLVASETLLGLIERDAAEFPASAAEVLGQGANVASGEGYEAACEWMLAGGAQALRQPPSAYAEWLRAHDTLSPQVLRALRASVRSMRARPLLSLLLPADGMRSDRLQACIASMLAQAYPDWELCIVADDEALSPAARAVVDAGVASSSRIRQLPGAPRDIAAWNRALATLDGAFLAVLDGLPVLPAHALLAFADAIARNPGARCFYSDSDRIDEAGRRHSPSFRPDWNPDLFLSRDYIGNAVFHDLALVREVGGFREAFAPAATADLALRCAGRGSDVPVHLPLVLWHWPATAPDEAVAESRRAAVREHLGERVLAIDPVGDGGRLQWPLPAQPPKASLVVPTRDRLDLLQRCVDSLLSLTEYPDFEVLVVDNQSSEAATLAYLAGLEAEPRVRVLRYDQPFNYSALNNFAVGHARGEIVALVNNDIEVISPGWLTEMVAQALRPGIGAVGAMLYYPDDTIQHAGVVVGLGGVAGHVYSREPRGSAGEEGRARLVQDLSAVTAACLVVRKSTYVEAGGLDERLTVAFNDVDFCLRLLELGYRNLWTPFAELYHHESASRGGEDTPEKLARFHSEVERMLERWGDRIRHDPAYHPSLSLAHGDAFALAAEPRFGLSTWATEALQ